MSDKTAQFVRQLDGLMGDAALYLLNPPLKGWEWEDDEDSKAESYEYVVVSAAVAPFSGPETYLFPSNAEGEVTDWGELPGSHKGRLSHAAALKRAGYRIVHEATS